MRIILPNINEALDKTWCWNGDGERVERLITVDVPEYYQGTLEAMRCALQSAKLCARLDSEEGALASLAVQAELAASYFTELAEVLRLIPRNAVHYVEHSEAQDPFIKDGDDDE